VRVLCYVLPEDLRPVLRDLHKYLGGEVIKGNPKDVISRIKEIASMINIGRFWVVGDVVCSNFIKYGIKPYVCVIDYRTLREELSHDLDHVSRCFRNVVKVRNPAGTITEEALTAITNLKGPSLVIVDGEEDLLGLVAILAADDGDVVTYGLPPNVGVVLIRVCGRVKELTNELLKEFIITRC